MTNPSADVAVLGAGPAGCIAARQLGQAGLDVLLLDAAKDTVSHHIESFPASGAPLLEDIGLLSTICEVSDGPAAALVLNWRNAPETRVFEGNGPLLLRRRDLHEALRQAANPHVRIVQTRVRRVEDRGASADVVTDAGTLSCRMVVDARGRLALKRPPTDLVALPFSARCNAPSHTMWLDALPRAWIWAASLKSGEIHGAVFQQAAMLSGSTVQIRIDHARHQLSLTSAFSGATDISVGKPVAAGLSVVADPVLSDRHILIGDAALARDPIASHGLVHAIRSGAQAAIAVRTMFDPHADSAAATAFLRHKQGDAGASARQATARAYRDQSRFAGPFWAQFEDEPPEAPRPCEGPVTLAKPLTRAPVIDGDRILWAPAIALPARHDFFVRHGSLTALDIAAACRPPALVKAIAARLGRAHPMPSVVRALEHLMRGGAFAQASPASPSKARARLTSQASSSDTIRDSVS